MQGEINFFSHKIEFVPDDIPRLKKWIAQIISANKQTLDCINYIFCSDSYLLQLNRRHLEHDYLTDILTFPYHSPQQPALHADIYISLDRVRDNALKFNCTPTQELHRVIVHGILHLIGYDDHSPEDKEDMRRLEDEALKLLNF